MTSSLYAKRSDREVGLHRSREVVRVVRRRTPEGSGPRPGCPPGARSPPAPWRRPAAPCRCARGRRVVGAGRAEPGLVDAVRTVRRRPARGRSRLYAPPRSRASTDVNQPSSPMTIASVARSTTWIEFGPTIVASRKASGVIGDTAPRGVRAAMPHRRMSSSGTGRWPGPVRGARAGRPCPTPSR